MTTPLTEAGRALHHELHAGCAAFETHDCPMSDRIAAIEREAVERRERVDPDLRAAAKALADGVLSFRSGHVVEMLATEVRAILATTEAPRDPNMDYERRDAILDVVRRAYPATPERVDPDPGALVPQLPFVALHREHGEERSALTGEVLDSGGYCSVDHQEWPCDAQRLLDYIAARERVDPDPFRSPVYECEADESMALAQQLHESIAEGQSTAETAKALRLLASPREQVDPDLRAVARDLYSVAVSEHGHDETHSADWPSCLPVHIAFNRYRDALGEVQ